jgi:hypothetical protein
MQSRSNPNAQSLGGRNHESIAGMSKPNKLSLRMGIVSIASLGSATLFCFGCSAHEYARQGQAQDAVTHLLAGGTYLSLLSFVISGVAFLAMLFKEK